MGFRLSNGSIGSAAHRLIGHGQCAKVEDPCPADQLPVDFLGVQTHICAGIAVEAEIPVAPCQSMHHRQGGMHLIVPEKSGSGDSGFRQSIFQLIPKAVPAHFADEGGGMSQLGQQGQHVAGSTAGICLQQRIALAAVSVLGQVDQQLAQGDHIIFFHNFHLITAVSARKTHRQEGKYFPYPLPCRSEDPGICRRAAPWGSWVLRQS